MTSDAIAKSTVLTRKQFMNEYGFSDSTERRGRTGGESWPPHIEIGPAGRVYYRRESVEAWLQEIESDEQQAQTMAPAADAPAQDEPDEKLWDGGDAA
ncbi:MAG: helix-turn-helix transcriptional regulator [Mycobacterium sp.]|uniref:helix-turn-helix transcriptional regulator n=1 Tax=Mycobacterium sp. TaxID=1785 RepID=UPI003F97090A